MAMKDMTHRKIVCDNPPEFLMEVKFPRLVPLAVDRQDLPVKIDASKVELVHPPTLRPVRNIRA